MKDLLRRLAGINIYTHNGILHAYINVWFYNGDGGDSYEDVYATSTSLLGLVLTIIWQEITWPIRRLEYQILPHINNATKVWWYENLMDTECPVFMNIADKIDKHINWTEVWANSIKKASII